MEAVQCFRVSVLFLFGRELTITLVTRARLDYLHHRRGRTERREETPLGVRKVLFRGQARQHTLGFLGLPFCSLAAAGLPSGPRRLRTARARLFVSGISQVLFVHVLLRRAGPN